MSAGQLAGGLFADTVGWRWAFAALVCGYLIVGLLLRQEVRRQQAAGLGAGLAAGARQGFVAQARLVLGAPWRAWCWRPYSSRGCWCSVRWPSLRPICTSASIFR